MQILNDYRGVKSTKHAKKTKVQHEWRNATEVAEYLHMSKSWVTQRIRDVENPLPAHPQVKDGDRGITRQFDLYEVDAWVLRR